MHLGNGNGKKRIKELESRLLELEEIVEKCSQAFDLLPVSSLENGLTWYPSNEAIRLLKRAKDASQEYTLDRYHR